MSGIGLLVLDLLVEIMFLLPSDIEQKFAFSQVSRHWRDVAVHNCLFWSSFAGHHSKADCYRVPIILERSGSSTLLHIQFRFRHHTAYVTHALNALVPYAARIEKLDIRFPRHLRGKPIEALLASNLEFLALQTLRLKYLQYVGIRTPILLTAPQLRVLDLEDFEPVSWETLLSPSLENICFHGSRAVEILFNIFNRCQRARRVVVYSSDWGRTETTYDFETFAHDRHLAPALRELELAISENDLGRVLRAAFPDVVLHTLTASIRKPDLLPLLTSALLPGVGALVVFELYERHRVEVRDEDGRIRRLQCMRHEEDSDFVFADVWKYLSIHYNLHKTVREIRTTRWESTEVFGDHPPQLQDEITLVLESPWIATPIIDVGSDIKIMRIPGLAKVEFLGALFLASLLWMLAHIEPPNGRKVEICIRSRKVRAEDTKEDAFGAFQTALDGTLWIICSQCRSQSVH